MDRAGGAAWSVVVMLKRMKNPMHTHRLFMFNMFSCELNESLDLELPLQGKEHKEQRTVWQVFYLEVEKRRKEEGTKSI